MRIVASWSKLLVVGVFALLVLLSGPPIAAAQEVAAVRPALRAQEVSAGMSSAGAQEAAAEDAASDPADSPDDKHHGDIIVARTLAELPAVVKPGETVYVTDATGIRNKYKMQGVSVDASTLLLERHGAVLQLPEDQVLNIAVRRSDRLWNGALIGGLIGASPLLVTAAVCLAVDGCASEALAASLFTGLIGAGIGVGVDAAFRETHLIYSAVDPAPKPRIVVAPMVGGQRKGALIQINF
jgi:hypothetical protein